MTARGNSRNTNSSMISETGCTEFSPRPHPVQVFKRSDAFSFPAAGWHGDLSWVPGVGFSSASSVTSLPVQTEEVVSATVRAGNMLGHGAERFVDFAFVVKSVSPNAHLKQLPFVLARDQCARDRQATIAARLLRHRLCRRAQLFRRPSPQVSIVRQFRRTRARSERLPSDIDCSRQMTRLTSHCLGSIKSSMQSG